MGCCSSAAAYFPSTSGNKAAGSMLQEGAVVRAVVVWGASGLRKADVFNWCDAYCVVRVGAGGSAWTDKVRGSGRRSVAVSGSENPKWNVGLAVDIKDIESAEVHVRVYDADCFTQDDFLGEARVLLADLPERGAEFTVPLTGEKAQGSLSISTGPVSLLEDGRIKPWAGFESIAPMGPWKPWNVADTSSDIMPMLVGKAPLPPTLRGIFWLTNQKRSSALASFAGPTRDGGGCSLGYLVGPRYSIRVSGDRVWAFADPTAGGMGSQKGGQLAGGLDLVYHFHFDSAESPKRCTIFPEASRLDFVLDKTELLEFDMIYEEQGNPEYPGSVTWHRPSYVLGKLKNQYTLVQVIDEHGARIQPAWEKFVAYQKSPEAGETPGVVWYREAEA